MILVVFTTLIALRSVSTAQTNLNEKIDQLNSTVKSVGAPQVDCESCTTMVAGKSEDDGSMMQACVQSICPDQGPSLSAMTKSAYEKAGLPNPLFDQEIAPLIRHVATSEAADKLARAESLKDWIKTAEPLRAPGGIKFFNLLSAFKDFSKVKFAADAAGTAIIDRPLTRAAFPELSDAEFEKKMALFTKTLVFQKTNVIEETDPARVQLRYGHRFMTVVDAAMNDILEKKKRIETAEEFKFLAQLDAFQSMTSVDRLKTGFAAGRIDPDVIRELNALSSMITLFHSMVVDPEFRKNLDSPPIDVKKQYALMGIDKLLQDRSAQATDTLKVGAKIQSPTCQTAFALAQEVLPTQKQIDVFKSRLGALREKFLSRSKGLVCEAAGPQLKAHIDQMQPILPMSQEQYLQTMKEALERAALESDKLKAQTQKMMTSPYKDTLYAIGVSSLQESESAPTATVDNICAGLIVDPVPDATTYLGQSFIAGPIPIKHAEKDGICHHELGHKLSYFMKYVSTCDKSSIMKTSKCLVENHTEFDANEKALALGTLAYGYEFRYGEEDWADLISAQVDEKSDNFACLFTKKLRKEDYKALSLKNPNGVQSHSSELFRLLHLHFLKNGKTPPQCETALAAKGERAQFKNCLTQ